MFDFAETVEALRKLAADGKRAGAESEALAIEDAVVVDCLRFLYEHMVVRNQLVGAAHLLAHAPLSIRDDPRVRRLVAHALGATARLDSAAHELVKAREGTYSVPDAILDVRQALPWRVLYWLRTVRVAQAKRALEYGCGHGSNVLACALHESAVDWTGIDVNAAQVADNRAQAGRVGARASFYADGDPDAPREAFDSVAVLHVLEHTAYPHDVLAAAERYARPGGHVVVVVPSDAGAAEVDPADLARIRRGEGMERSHVNSMGLGDLVALVAPRGRLLDASQSAVAPNALDACVVYAPFGSDAP